MRVIACVIERNGRYLICRRPEHKRHGGLWEFPGGKIEPGETMLAAAQRELQEELGMNAQNVGDALLCLHDEGSPFIIEFVPVQTTGEPQLIEHTAIQWLSPQQLSGLPLAPSDRRFVSDVLL